jgi:hypothetical protein
MEKSTHGKSDRTKRLRVVALSGLALVLMALGCGKPELAAPGLRGFPGENPAETKAYIASLDFSVRDSVFEGNLECEQPDLCGNSDSVRLRIVPQAKAHHVPIRNVMSQGPGHVVAMIENLEDKPFQPYGMQPRDTGYLWIGAMQEGGRKIAIFRISADGQATRLVTATEAGWCPGSNAGRTVPAVHMNPVAMCRDSTLYTAPVQSASVGRLASVSPEIVASAAAAAFTHARGLWFSCSLGCCEASAFLQ